MKKEINLYLISGKGGTGKDTLAKAITMLLEAKNKKVCNINITRTLKGYVKDYFGWDGKEETKPRDLLQTFGSEIIREKLNKPYFHIDRLTEDIEVLSYYFDTFIVADIRFPLEIETLKERFDNVKVINVRKNGIITKLTEEQQKHVSEIALDNYKDFDYIIYNDGNLEDIIEKAKKVVEGDLI